MSSATSSIASSPEQMDSEATDFSLIFRQIQGILRLELRRQLLRGRAFLLYFLAFMPLLILSIWTVTPIPRELGSAAATQPLLAAIFQIGYIRVMIFLGTLLFFSNLFRSEILEKSLHYYFLAPVRREVLVVGKYLSALIATAGTFAISTIGLYVLLRLPWGFGGLMSHLFTGSGLGHLLSYVGIAALACAGYGAIFLLTGLFVRNPIIIGVFLWGWEFINPFLPSLLKKFSVVHYLQGLYPLPLPNEFKEVGGMLETLIDPTPAWIAIPGLLIFVVVLLATASFKVRRMEVNYGQD